MSTKTHVGLRVQRPLCVINQTLSVFSFRFNWCVRNGVERPLRSHCISVGLYAWTSRQTLKELS